MTRITATLLTGVAAIAFTSSAMAADLIVYEPAAPIVYDTPAAGAWDGAYIGVFGGYGSGEVDHTGEFDPGLFDEPGADLDISGWLIGLRAGADFTASPGFVLGVVGDIAWSDQSGEGTFDDLNFGFDEAVVSYELDWQGSLRGRVGFDAGMFLPYLTGGLAFGHMNHTINIDDDGDQSGDSTYIGFTVGGGVEVAVVENVSLNLEYRYTDYGSQTMDMGLGDDDPSFSITSHAVTAGVNFRF